MTIIARLSVVVMAFVITQSLVAAAVTAGFIIGGFSLWLVHKEVVGITEKLDRQDARLAAVEGTVKHIEDRWKSGGQ